MQLDLNNLPSDTELLRRLVRDIARIGEAQPAVISETPATQPRRGALPDHLPREDIRLDVECEVCICCGDALHLVGGSVSEMLDWVPAQLRVVRTTRPKYAFEFVTR
jgi:transposase